MVINLDRYLRTPGKDSLDPKMGLSRIDGSEESITNLGYMKIDGSADVEGTRPDYLGGSYPNRNQTISGKY